MAKITSQQAQQLNQINQTLSGIIKTLQKFSSTSSSVQALPSSSSSGSSVRITTSSPSTSSIIIPSGATLSGLAKQYGTTVSELMNLNPQIKDPNKIYAGSVLYVPSKTQGSSNQSAIQQINQQSIQQPTQQLTDYQNQMLNLLRKYEEVLKQEPPTITELTPVEKQTFEQERQQLRQRYESALENLKKKHEEETKRLLGRYAAMGFSEPGVTAGPLASEPGIVTKALQEIKEGQRREITDLEQAMAGNELAIAKAEQEAARRVREAELEEFYKRQEAMKRQLEGLMQKYQWQEELKQPRRIEIGGRIFEEDPVTKQLKDVTPSTIGWQTMVDEQTGRVYRVNPDTGEFQEIGKIAAKKVETKQDDAARDSVVRTFLSNQKGQDQKVNAESYMQALQEWIRLGGSQSDFFALFPKALWMREEERKRFEEMIGGKIIKTTELLPGEEDL